MNWFTKRIEVQQGVFWMLFLNAVLVIVNGAMIIVEKYL
jgi:hypothetical protein